MRPSLVPQKRRLGGRDSVLESKIPRPMEEGTHAHGYRYRVLGTVRGAPVSSRLFGCNRKYASPHYPNFIKKARFQDTLK